MFLRHIYQENGNVAEEIKVWEYFERNEMERSCNPGKLYLTQGRYDDAYCEVGEYDKAISSFLKLLDDARILGVYDEICDSLGEADGRAGYRNGLLKVTVEKHPLCESLEGSRKYKPDNR